VPAALDCVLGFLLLSVFLCVALVLFVFLGVTGLLLVSLVVDVVMTFLCSDLLIAVFSVETCVVMRSFLMVAVLLVMSLVLGSVLREMTLVVSGVWWWEWISEMFDLDSAYVLP
jgi:hypothetical protein